MAVIKISEADQSWQDIQNDEVGLNPDSIGKELDWGEVALGLKGTTLALVGRTLNMIGAVSSALLDNPKQALLIGLVAVSTKAIGFSKGGVVEANSPCIAVNNNSYPVNVRALNPGDENSPQLPSTLSNPITREMHTGGTGVVTGIDYQGELGPWYIIGSEEAVSSSVVTLQGDCDFPIGTGEGSIQANVESGSIGSNFSVDVVAPLSDSSWDTSNCYLNVCLMQGTTNILGIHASYPDYRANLGFNLFLTQGWQVRHPIGTSFTIGSEIAPNLNGDWVITSIENYHYREGASFDRMMQIYSDPDNSALVMLTDNSVRDYATGARLHPRTHFVVLSRAE